VRARCYGCWVSWDWGRASVVGKGVSEIRMATRCSRIYLSTWSSMSEFPRDEGGCPGPEAWE
jgi:hypothetical protein